MVLVVVVGGQFCLEEHDYAFLDLAPRLWVRSPILFSWLLSVTDR